LTETSGLHEKKSKRKKALIKIKDLIIFSQFN